MKHSVLPFICCVALCLVAVEGLGVPAKQKLIKACKDRGATPAICMDGVRELENVSLVIIIQYGSLQYGCIDVCSALYIMVIDSNPAHIIVLCML